MNQKRRHENGESVLKQLTSSGLRVWLIFAESFFFICAPLEAHEPTTQPQEEPSATSLLDSTTTNGRIGGYQYRGSLKPTPGTGSRFSNNAKYGNAGNIVGVEHNGSASRFQGGTAGRFQSQMDFNILALRNEFERSRVASKANALASIDSFDSGAPRVTSARVPEIVPYASDRRPHYGKYPDQLLARQEAVESAGSGFVHDSASLTSSEEANASVAPQLLWMRGPTPQSLLSRSNRQDEGSDHTFPNGTDALPLWNLDDAVYNQFGYSERALGGSLGFQSIQPADNGVALSPAPSPEQLQKAFREYLEAQLLRSPDVNPLSPVQVFYQDGVATVRGVVPSPTARAAAGYILLADPRVSKVNNLMTCIHDDSANIGAPASASSPSDSTTNRRPQ